MELTVDATFNWVNETADAAALGATLRVFSVAMLDAYYNTSSPQTNLTAALPWARAAPASIPGMSALCYYFGAELVKKHPDTPVGLLASSWGGTAIQPWMSPAALASCSGVAPALSHAELAASADPALAVVGALLLHGDAARGGAAQPTANSVLYNSMIAPLLLNPKRGILWYQARGSRARSCPRPRRHFTLRPPPPRALLLRRAKATPTTLMATSACSPR